MQKKTLSIILAVIITLSTASMAGAEGIIKMGYDNSGTIETKYFDNTDTNKTESGYSVGVEFLKTSESRLKTGIGAEYQFMRSVSVIDENEEISFIPAYLTARLNLFRAKTTPYLQGKVGYGIFQVDEAGTDATYNGGLYYGLGAGLTLAEDVQVQLDYSVHNGEKQWENIAIPYNYSKIGLSLGLVF